MPQDLLDELGEPPHDVLKKDEWWSRLIEVLMLGVAKGEPWKSMLELATRASAQASRLRESEIKAQVAELLEREERETSSDVSPEMVDVSRDPITSANRRPACRRDP